VGYSRLHLARITALDASRTKSLREIFKINSFQERAIALGAGLNRYRDDADTRSCSLRLENSSAHDEDKTGNGRNDSHDMEGPPAITKLLPVRRQR